jgi:hypothetical protein
MGYSLVVGNLENITESLCFDMATISVGAWAYPVL